MQNIDSEQRIIKTNLNRKPFLGLKKSTAVKNSNFYRSDPVH